MRSIVVITRIFLISLICINPLTGQVARHFTEDYAHDDELRQVHITDIINTEEFINSAIENTRIRNPHLYARAFEKAGIVKDAATYSIGDEQTFYVLKFDGRTGSQYTAGWFDEVQARLMGVGDVAQVWVSIAELENENVTQTEIDAIMEALEERTPAASYDPNKGIFDLVEEYFGLPPDIDQNGIRGAGNGKTDVLLVDIIDGWEPDNGRGFIAGFFFTLDQNTTQQFSNRRDIIYIDTYPGIYNPVQNRRNPSRPLSTLVHEFQHLVFHSYRGTSQEETWLNEGLSEFSEAFCGFGLRNPSLYFSNTNRSMTYWGESTSEDVLQDYSRVALWTLYLWEQLGNEIITRLVQTPSSFGRGIQIVNRAASEVGSAWRFPDLITHFNLANFINDRNIDPRFGYEYSFTGRPSPRGYHNDPNINLQGRQIAPYASYFIEYSLGDSLEIRFDSANDFTIKAIEIARDRINVKPVSIGERYVQHDYGDVYRTIVFAIINTGGTTVTFNYSSEGGLRYYVDEYKFDDGSPKQITPGGATFLGFPNGEQYIGAGWAVQFTPEIPENQLLGARIYAAFGQEFQGSTVPADAPKSFYFHVWGDNNGRPGENLIEPFIVETTRQTFPGDFMDIELYDYAEFLTDIQGPIYVGFTHDTVYAVSVGMTNLLQNQNRTFAFNGPHHPTQPDQWRRMFDLQLGDGTSLQGWNMMMRAVFAVYDPDRQIEPIEPLPNTFVLEQNYPNPFNHSTIIEYDLPDDAHIRIEIYDLLGRRVRTLVDDMKYTVDRLHRVEWNATDDNGNTVSSGVYYYRLITGESVITKKMVFLR
jgi:hypothetical protein